MGIEFEIDRPAVESSAAKRRRRISAFSPAWRRHVAKLTSCSKPLEDLADSFPAMLFALATGYGTAEQRRRALACIEAGLPLKQVAQSLGLPIWLRRFPACSFVTPLPPMIADAEFGEAVVGRMPVRKDDAAVWLDRLVSARTVVGREFALWLAKDRRLLPPVTSEEDFNWLVAWAWHSQNSDTQAGALLRQGWNPAMPWKKARDEIIIWRKRVDLALTLGSGLRDCWFADGCALGLEITALRTAQDFIAESAVMENCLDQYAAPLAYGRIRVFRVRKGGRSVASLELALRSDDATVPSISQLRGPRNRRTPTHVWQAVHAWLGAQPFKPLVSVPTSLAEMAGRAAALWSAYEHRLEQVALRDRLHPRQSSLSAVLQRSRPTAFRTAANLTRPRPA